MMTDGTVDAKQVLKWMMRLLPAWGLKVCFLHYQNLSSYSKNIQNYHQSSLLPLFPPTSAFHPIGTVCVAQFGPHTALPLGIERPRSLTCYGFAVLAAGGDLGGQLD